MRKHPAIPIVLLTLLCGCMPAESDDSTGEVEVNRVVEPLTPDAGMFNVQQFGALGDGVTDDRAAIQNAINAAAAQGGTVLFPRGIYLVKPAPNGKDYALVLKSGVTLSGVGRNLVNDQRGSVIHGPNSGVDVVRISNLDSSIAVGSTIRDLSITGGYKAKNLISSYEQAAHVVIENVLLSGPMSNPQTDANAPNGACIQIKGNVERWTLRHIVLNGGNYGVKHSPVACAGCGAPFHDKMLYDHVVAQYQHRYGWHIDVRYMRTSTWVAPVFEGNTSPQAGNYSRGSMWLAGELWGVSITDIYSENVGSAKTVTGTAYDDITLTRNTDIGFGKGFPMHVQIIGGYVSDGNFSVPRDSIFVDTSSSVPNGIDGAPIIVQGLGGPQSAPQVRDPNNKVYLLGGHLTKSATGT